MGPNALLRFLRRNPVFTAIAVLTLAFGIGGNTAIFTLLDAVTIHSLPYRDPGRLMAIETHKAQQPEVEAWTSALDLFDLRDHNQSFANIVGISPIWSVVLTGRGPAERLETLYVSAGFFPMLGVNAALVGWHHPYCRVLGDELARCFAIPSSHSTTALSSMK